MIIRAVDNFLPDDDFYWILRYCKSATYLYGETDEAETFGNPKFCVGMVHQMYPLHDSENENYEKKDSDKIAELINTECHRQFSELDGFELGRMYINCFAPSENPYFHIDSVTPESESFTCLYYTNDTWNLDDGGETQFYKDNILYGVTPEPNRMVLFDGRIKHKATSFRDRHRFTIALKYFPCCDT
jgi:Rps23 Pro-64 3,4-dihydroxylase Tpa1-like proline 4-hydroxylase